MSQLVRKKSRAYVTAYVLRKTARAMLPFYIKIAKDDKFARKWSKAVVTANLNLMEELLAKIPSLAGNQNYGTNAIGYFISFPFTSPVGYYTNGTTIPPGLVQFTFNTQAHRYIARALLPFYRKLATDSSFAKTLACAIRRKDQRTVKCLVRKLVKSAALRSVIIEDSGVALLFRTPFSKYPYRNLLFRESY
ncbi:hypothetical protein [Paenibacillus sp. GCM10012306]|uniref:hypothetical protein n=1 Tax=Paenibacillus sp. GCM10012306 TaxID=3317342 RepID=UPI00360604AC